MTVQKLDSVPDLPLPYTDQQWENSLARVLGYQFPVSRYHLDVTLKALNISNTILEIEYNSVSMFVIKWDQ